MRAAPPNDLARALRSFFSEHLPQVQGASPHTVRSYRDALALFLRFLAADRGRSVIDLDLSDFEPDAVIAFLDHLEQERANGVATRNARLAALHAFARFVAGRHPEHLETCQLLLAVPFKRAPIPVVEYLDASELRALFDAIDSSTSQRRSLRPLPRSRTWKGRSSCRSTGRRSRSSCTRAPVLNRVRSSVWSRRPVLVRLLRQYGPQRLDKAVREALLNHAPRFQSAGSYSNGTRAASVSLRLYRCRSARSSNSEISP